MPTVAELAARADREVAYVLFIDGVKWAYCDREELCGTGGFSWIGQFGSEGDREVLPGLTVPETITFSTNLETGALESDDGASFTVIDFDRRMIEFLREPEDFELVGERLSARPVAAPATLLSADGQTSVDLHGKYINHEAIGPFGERRQYQCIQGAPLPGLDHAAYTGDIQELAPSAVYDAPPHFKGRRVSLYRIFLDVTQPLRTYPYWKTWADMHASGYGLVWAGTIADISATGTTLKIACDGPSSWLRKRLNALRPSEWRKMTSSIKLSTKPGQRTDMMACSFYYQQGGNVGFLQGASSAYTVLDVLPSTGTVQDYLSAISARVATVSAQAGPDVTWTTFYGSEARVLYGRIETETTDSAWAAVWTLTLHRSVWILLGYDVELQTAKGGLCESNTDMLFTPAQNAPGDDYWTAKLWTVPTGYLTPYEAGGVADNNGTPRLFLPIYEPGVSALYPQGQQEIQVGLGPSTPFIEGQTNRAPVEYTFDNGGGTVDTHGYIAFKAQYRETRDEDAIVNVQIAVCGWRNDTTLGGDTFGADSDSVRKVYIARWIDPRWAGLDRKKIDRVWAAAAGDTEFCPVALVGWNHDSGDRADLVMLRTMLSTGTAYWTGYDGQNPVRTLGQNAHPDAETAQGDDVEIADLGLAVPASMVDWVSFRRACDELPLGGKSSPLALCKFFALGPFDADQLLAQCMEPRGWGMGFVAGRFRLFSRARKLSYGDTEVAISADDLASDDIPYVPEVEFNPLTPKDGFTIKFGEPLDSEAGSEKDLELKLRALDNGARVRQDNAVLEVDGQGLVPVPLWQGGPGSPPSWQPAATALWSRVMADYFAAPFVLVKKVPVMWTRAKDIGPGSVVRVSLPFAASREGEYGLTNRIGRVVRVVHNLQTLTSELDVLLQQGDPLDYRLFAPIAVVVDGPDVTTVEQRHDAATRTFYCKPDAFGHGEAGFHDVSLFAEPAYLGVGGNALVYGWQWDGRTWEQTFSFRVESISTANNSITYTAGSLTGTWWEARYTVLVMAPHDDQPGGSWPRSLFLPHTRANYTFGAGTKGKPLV